MKFMKQVYGNIIYISIEKFYNTVADQTALMCGLNVSLLSAYNKIKFITTKSKYCYIHGTACKGLHKTCIITIFTLLEVKKNP